MSKFYVGQLVCNRNHARFTGALMRVVGDAEEDGYIRVLYLKAQTPPSELPRLMKNLEPAFAETEPFSGS